MIIHRNVGFHAPVTLPTDGPEFCQQIEKVIVRRSTGKKKGEEFTLPGNSHIELAKIRSESETLQPKAKKILELEAQLSAAYGDYDKASKALWNLLAEARDHAREYADRHGDHEVAAVAEEFVYHTGRAARAKPAVAVTSVDAGIKAHA